MNYKKKFLLLTLFLIIILQTFLYTNNKQKTSFKYLQWTLNEVSIGKLISISFFSGFFISTLLNTRSTIFKKNTFKNIQENSEHLNEVDIKSNGEEDIKSYIEMPPQRDIRDAQPTISVNYRVIKNTEENNLKRDQNFSNNTNYRDDWGSNDNDW